MRPIAFVVNGEPGGAMDTRARSMARSFAEPITFVYRSGNKIRAIASILRELVRVRPRTTVVFDIGFSGVIAALGRRSIGGRLVVDTGDAIFALAKSLGRGPAGLAATLVLEETALRSADAVVVRGTYHKEHLAKKNIAATVIQDGVDVDDFAVVESGALRRELGASDRLTFGVVGSSVWIDKLGITYGWELVEALAQLRDAPVFGIMVGGGSGIARLKERARELDVSDRIAFVGQVPYGELSKYLSAIDVCISTQTNDLVGRVRTTGKLPLYMASGRYILATDVGEAGLVLPEEMRVRYDGVVDRTYPSRIASRIRELVVDRGRLARGRDNIQVARERFDYAVLGARYRELLARLASDR